MTGRKIQVVGMQVIGNAGRRRGNLRPISELQPESLKAIMPWFSRGRTAKWIAEELRTNRYEVLEYLVREMTGARHPGPCLVERRPPQSELTVRELRARA